MTTTFTGSYHALDRQLRAAGAAMHAAEAHGALCGIVCASGRAGPALWLEHLLGEGNTRSAAAQACGDLLEALQNDIVSQLHDDALGFDLLLPSDAESLPARTLALVDWSGGYLYGLALGGVRETAEVPETVREVMHDFYELSHAGFSETAPDEDDETAYAEIIEFMRMSVLLVHEELQPLPGTARLQ